MIPLDRLSPAFTRPRVRFHSPGLGRLSAIAACCLGLWGCDGPSPGKLLQSARNHLALDEVGTAIIESRNALERQPEWAQGRLMLARALVADGELLQASAELERAVRFGASEAEIAPVEAALMAAVSAHKALVGRYKDTVLPDPANNAELQLLLAGAYRGLGDLRQAEAAVQRALVSLPNDPKATATLAALAMDGGDLVRAQALVDEVLQAAPTSGHALLVKGDLLAKSAADVTGALNAYREVLKTRPRSLDAHGRAVSLLLSQRDLPGAKAQLAQMVKALPGRPFTIFYQASVASMEGDWKRVRELTQVLLKGPLQVPQVQFIAGVAEARLGSWEQADLLLSKAAKGLPGAVDPAVQLAGLRLQLGKPDEALDALREVLAAKPPVPEALLLAGQALAQKGDFKGADIAFSRAAAIRPGDAQLRVASALSRLSRGDTAAGVAELKAAAKEDRAGVSIDMMLLSVLVRQADLATAMTVVDGIEAKLPGQALPGLLRARVHRQMGDLNAARASYESLLSAHPGHAAATLDLVTLDLAERNLAGARKRLETVLQRDPRSALAFLALADLERREGKLPSVSFQWLDKAVKANPTDGAVWKAVLGFHRETGDSPALLARAREAAAAVPNDPDVLFAVAQAQLAANDAQQGMSTLNRVLEVDNNNVPALLRLAQLHFIGKRFVAAQAHVDRLLGLQPDSLQVLRLAYQLAQAEGESTQAAALISAAQRRDPQSPVGWQLEAEAAIAQKKWPVAIAALRKALTKQESYPIAGQLYLAYLAAERKGEAEAFAAEWMARRPNDFDFVNLLGEQAARREDWKVAESRFRRAATLRPDVAAVQNNLAYALVKLKSPEALKIAARAVEMVPWSATFLDTLATAYAANNQTDRAIRVQARVVELAPQSGTYRLQLARYHLASGDKGKALQQLEVLAGRGQDAGVDSASVDELLRQAKQ